MARTFSFEKLNVWEKARQLSIVIDQLTKSFTNEDKFGLISKMRRCAISVSSTIAEGSERHSSKDKARFTKIAYSSLLELLNQLILSHDLGFITEEQLTDIRKSISEIVVMLDVLHKSHIK